jgi:hypothetical protein
MKSRPDPQAGPQTIQTPEVVGKLIRYALSEMSADNAHHEFEHLCRHLARRRICSNILPATGPVSGGGDRGADFETLHVESGSGTSRYWRLVATGKVLFACSLERNLKRKVKADVEAAAKFGEVLERMYFFYNRPIKVADRNKFKESAFKEHGIKLEIVDGNAIAEFLADPELLWVAEKYLSLPSEVSLPPCGAAPTWYSSLLTASESELCVNADTFYQLKSALRYASADPDHHSEIPKLICRVQLFRSHHNRVIARKAFYEEFVAALRGLNAAEGYEPQLIEYLSAIPTLDNVSELEDASTTLSYLNGACARGILNIEASVRQKFRDGLLKELDSRITSVPSFVTCALLYTKGHVLLSSWILEGEPGASITAPLTRAAESAVGIWDAFLKHAEQVPLFPVERLSPVINFVFPLVDSEKFTAFVKRLDALIAKRAGTQRVAEQKLLRASALLDEKRYLRALHEFHESLLLSQSLESQSTAITVCLQLAALYQHLGLHHAAKYYGLAAAFAALRFPEVELRRLAAVGLAQAAQADYAAGAWLLFFVTYKTFVLAANEFAMAGKEPFKEDQWAKLDLYAMISTRVAEIIDSGLHTRCMESLKRLDAEDIYIASKSDLDKMLGGLDLHGVELRCAEEGIAAPFCDYAPARITSWRQLGVTWRVEWSSTYESESHGESLCAALQIIFAALAGTEFSIIAGDVAISLDTSHSGDVKVEQLADNETLRFSVSIDPACGLPLEDQLGVAYHILIAASAIPAEDFKSRFEMEFKRGLPHRVGVYVPAADAFQQFYLQREYEDLHGADPTERRRESQGPRTWEGISETTELHAQFVESEALQLISNRYHRTAKLFPHTIQQLSSDPAFRELVLKLRGSGWKDWHILLAVGNVRVTSLLNARATKYQARADVIMREGEGVDDPLTPAAFFDEEGLRTCLQLSHVGTLRGMGFRVDQMTPNFPGIDAFLRRFKYWELDVPHADPFYTS